ncbi:ureidoglycolate lyase [Aestuariibius insulae]|uniref:ureidoglycolate lyase n=1 Tax=Aestuariibius insulae TaxID=2058287 RepID=UPI00345E91F0
MTPEPLSAEAFAPFGDVLEASGPSFKINEGFCDRYTDRARLDLDGGRFGISLFQAAPRALPYRCNLLERHPQGSQSFVPMTDDPFLVIVAEDEGGRPVRPRAFLTDGRQGVSYLRNTWHGVLTPLAGSGLFAVVDRIGDGPNLEEYVLDPPLIIG